MSKILDSYSAGTIADALDEFIADLGFPPREAIPGLVEAIIRQAGQLADAGDALDEATDILASAQVED